MGEVLHGSLLQLLFEHFFNIDISQGSVATRLRCGGIFKYELVANLPVSLPVKEFWKSVNIWGSYGQEFGVLFFETQCISDWRHFSDFHISQGSIATCLSCGGIFKHEFAANLLPSPWVKKSLKIGSYLAKLWARVWCLVFFAHGVYRYLSMHSHLGGRQTQHT